MKVMPSDHGSGGYMHWISSAHWLIVSLLLINGPLGFGPWTADARPIDPPANLVNLRFPGSKLPNEYRRLIGMLRAQGASVRSTGEKVRQPFFSVPGRILKVNNEAIQVFEYSKIAITESQAKRVSPDGKTIGNSKPSWMSTPHFFKSQKLIVIYVGDDQTILKILQAALGNQFAGG
jgi:hypothetical protein